MRMILEHTWRWFATTVAFMALGSVALGFAISPNPWADEPHIRDWAADAIISFKEWRCMSSGEYKNVGTIAGVVFDEEEIGTMVRESLCDYYNEQDFWGTIGFGR